MKDFHTLTIADVRKETPDAICVTLDIPAGLAEQYAYTPGQHLVFRTTIDGEELRRNYSICSGPGERKLRIAIKRIKDGRFSNLANDTFAKGISVEVMPPAGRFAVPDGGGEPRSLVAIAAGAGITPIIAMIRHTLTSEPETSFTLYYGNRDTSSILFREELEDLKDRFLDRFRLVHVLSREIDRDIPLLGGRITPEKIQTLIRSAGGAEQFAHFFVCGPGSMIKDVRAALMDMNVARSHIHFEFFAPIDGGSSTGKAAAEAVRPADAPDAATAGTDAQVAAIIDGTQIGFSVAPGEAVIDAALRQGITLPYSCKGGMCCTCRCRVVEGESEMVTNYSLQQWEIDAGFTLACQTRPRGEKLILDFDAV